MKNGWESVKNTLIFVKGLR